MEEKSEEPPDRRLKRVLGASDVYALVYPDVQSTFYFLLGFIALAVGTFTPLGVLYSVLLMSSIVLTYTTAAVKFPTAGGLTST